jgi:hypothetical protein
MQKESVYKDCITRLSRKHVPEAFETVVKPNKARICIPNDGAFLRVGLILYKPELRYQQEGDTL